MMRIKKLTDDQFEEYMEFAMSNNWKLTPESVVNHARNPESSLHELFEWDIQKAAEMTLHFQAESLFHRNKQFFRKAKRCT